MKKQDKKTFGSRLRQIRKQAKLSQTKFAELLGFASHVPISLYENGNSFPGFHELLAISRNFDVDLNLLITGKTSKAEPGDGSRIFEILRPYVEAHIGEIAREVTNIEDEIISLQISPDRSIEKNVPGRIQFLRKLLRDHLVYFAKVMDDVEKAKEF